MIREAVADDLPHLVELGRAMHAESRFATLRFDPARLNQTLAGLLENPGGFLWVAEHSAGVVGCMAAIIVQHWCSSDLFATDLALFMLPSHRGTLAPARLVNRYQGWAADRGARITQLGVTAGINTEAAVSLYERIGFRRCGVILEAA